MLPYNLDISVTVSLTSYPARIKVVPEVIKSIFNQTVKPDRVLLWLAEEQFSEKEASLPAELRALKNQGLEIMWCDDLRPHKKYFYTMQKYPDDIIITVDDDVKYKPDTIEKLLASYIKFPFAVSALRAHCITFDEHGCINPYRSWARSINTPHFPSHALMATGVSGVLYPPHCFGQEAFNKDFIIENCLNADDLWLKTMELIHNIPVVLAAPSDGATTIEGSQTEALFKSNDREGGNDIQLRNILNSYDSYCGSRYTLTDRIRISSASFISSDFKERGLRSADT